MNTGEARILLTCHLNGKYFTPDEAILLRSILIGILNQFGVLAESENHEVYLVLGLPSRNVRKRRRKNQNIKQMEDEGYCALIIPPNNAWIEKVVNKEETDYIIGPEDIVYVKKENAGNADDEDNAHENSEALEVKQSSNKGVAIMLLQIPLHRYRESGEDIIKQGIAYLASTHCADIDDEIMCEIGVNEQIGMAEILFSKISKSSALPNTPHNDPAQEVSEPPKSVEPSPPGQQKLSERTRLFRQLLSGRRNDQ